MATLVLSAAGLALGGALGGSAFGLSGAVLGRAAGAMLGRAIDERLLGQGAAPVETGRVDRFRLTGAAEGAAIARAYGCVRLGGQVIWATRFLETATTTGGGKGAPAAPETTTFSYSVSLALALCEGPITGVGRVWADGEEIALDSLQMTVHRGTSDQLLDPRLEAVEGAGRVPAFRGTAYVVIEDLDLGRFGNRVPQLSFEVHRPAPQRDDASAEDMSRLLRGVCLIPGTGEYSLASEPVWMSSGFGESRPANLNTVQGKADLLVSLDQLGRELPRVESVVLVVCWFGDDLRCGHCRVRPEVEQTEIDGEPMAWSVSGLARAAATRVPRLGERPVYGGTPADAAVIQGIRELARRGRKVVFYPFLLMEQMAGNSLPDPYTGREGQPALPWRGRITLSVAPGRPGTPDGTAQADAEVAAFFGACAPSDFLPGPDGVGYQGPDEWSFRRMILHYAHLCAVAGGVDAFCIGTELRGLTWIRGAQGFPSVDQLRRLAAEVKAILPAATITYAADWSEYAGYQPPSEPGTMLFHLDPLWADPNIGVVAIDNYLPLSDWRDSDDHLDAHWGSIHALDYLTANVAGGEWHDWFYHSDEARAAQIRTPITDGDGEPWVWGVKAIRGWWENEHRDRIAGVRQAAPSPWVPMSKPIWFTEFGCPAVDKGTNEPNKFIDPKSSESTPPVFSNGLRDELIQQQYLRATFRHWAGAEANPISPIYGGRMVDMDRAHVWSWDARPFPAFPNDRDLWADGDNHARGHWVTGRATARTLDSLAAEIARASGAEIARADGAEAPDVTRLFGHLPGMLIEDAGSARAALQPLMLAFGFDAAERDGRLALRSRTGRAQAALDADDLLHLEGGPSGLERLRAPGAEAVGRVQLSFTAAGADHAPASAEAVLPDDPLPALSRTALPLVLRRDEARRAAERWLAEARLARDTARFALPPSRAALGPGDTVRLAGALWRIDRVEDRGARLIEAVRVDPETYRPHEVAEELPAPRAVALPVPVEAVFLDLPLLTGAEIAHAPHVALAASPWPGAAALHHSDSDEAYATARIVPAPATLGTTRTALRRAPPGLWDRGPALRVALVAGALASVAPERLLAGANAAAIGSGRDDLWEIFQFAEAELVGPRTYDLRLRLRGQAGTDGVMPQDWPAGSVVVILDGRPAQWDYPPAWRETLRHYRWGPLDRPPGDPSWRHAARAFRGVGLRPYSPCHLRARAEGGGWRLGWIRRTRIDGDAWTAPEVPLGEEREAYLVEVRLGGVLRRRVEVAAPGWSWTAAMRAEDGPGLAVVSVAQISDRWGPGPAAEIELPA